MTFKPKWIKSTELVKRDGSNAIKDDWNVGVQKKLILDELQIQPTGIPGMGIQAQGYKESIKDNKGDDTMTYKDTKIKLLEDIMYAFKNCLYTDDSIEDFEERYKNIMEEDTMTNDNKMEEIKAHESLMTDEEIEEAADFYAQRDEYYKLYNNSGDQIIKCDDCIEVLKKIKNEKPDCKLCPYKTN